MEQRGPISSKPEDSHKADGQIAEKIVKAQSFGSLGNNRENKANSKWIKIIL